MTYNVKDDKTEIMLREEIICDLDNSMFIAFNGIPLVQIENDWTVPQILEKLSEVRKNYINAKIKELSLPRVAAML